MSLEGYNNLSPDLIITQIALSLYKRKYKIRVAQASDMKLNYRDNLLCMNRILAFLSSGLKDLGALGLILLV